METLKKMKLKDFLKVRNTALLKIIDSNNRILYSEVPKEEIGDSITLKNLKNRKIYIISADIFVINKFGPSAFQIKLK